MDVRRERILLRLAEVIIFLASIFLLLDAMLEFTGHQLTPSAPPQHVSQNIDSANLSTSCTGGFSNERTVGGVTQVASQGTPFNAYRVTLTNIGSTVITVHGVNVELVNSQNKIFSQHYTHVGDGAGVTLNPGQSRRIVEAYGISRPVAWCEILSWQLCQPPLPANRCQRFLMTFLR
ncbi:MAG TPA: hypothetical protein VIX86_25575 [Streptosporangiaceae bacterium]